MLLEMLHKVTDIHQTAGKVTYLNTQTKVQM